MEVTEENRDRIDQVIQDYVADRAVYGRCSKVVEEASGQIASDRTMREELIQRLQRAAGVQTIEE